MCEDSIWLLYEYDFKLTKFIIMRVYILLLISLAAGITMIVIKNFYIVSTLLWLYVVVNSLFDYLTNENRD